MKFDRAVFELPEAIDRQTDRRTHQNTLHRYYTIFLFLSVCLLCVSVISVGCVCVCVHILFLLFV